jgi:hypothetical protein
MQDETFFKIFATGVAASMMFSFLVIFYRYYSKSSDKNFDLQQSIYLLFITNGMLSYLVFILVMAIEIVRYVSLYY